VASSPTSLIQKGAPLWRSLTKERELSDSRMNRQDDQTERSCKEWAIRINV
jgi:hypothetical protein